MGAPLKKAEKTIGGILMKANTSLTEGLDSLVHGSPSPKKPKPPPAPVDDSQALFREMSRAATDRQLRRSKGRANAFAGGGYLGSMS